MGKSYRREVENDDFEYTDMDLMSFMDMETDFDDDELLASNFFKKSDKKRSQKGAGRKHPSHRHLPDDWQEFDFGGNGDSNWN